MADDDRYRWLDDEAAERLLRGSVVNARSAPYGGRHGAAHDNVEDAPTSAYGTTYESGHGRSHTGAPGRPQPGTPSWARHAESAGHTHPLPEQRIGEDHPEARLALLLDTLVAEQTATLHALGAARTGAVGDAGGELPGEAAAVAAFRAAHTQAAAEHSGTVDISAGPTESSTVVGRRAAARESRRRSRDRRTGGARRSPLIGRPLRAGFAMAVAGCALGGAAVAAGTGVLPTPFGGDSPAASVSPLASPGTERESAAGGGSPYDGDPRRGTREGDSPSSSPSGEDLAGTERGRKGKSPGPKNWWQDGKNLSESQKKAMARAFCNAYENGDLTLKDRLRLELVAGGAANVKKFCDKNDGGRDDEAAAGGASNGGGAPGPGGPDGPGQGPGGTSGNDGGDEGGGSGGHDDGGAAGGDDSGGGSEGPGGSRPDDSGGQGTDGGIDGGTGGDAGTTSAAPSETASPGTDSDASTETDTGADSGADAGTSSAKAPAGS